MIRHTIKQLSESTKNSIFSEQAGPGGGMEGLMSMVGGPGKSEEPVSDDQKMFERFKKYQQIVYWARQQIMKDAEDSRKMGMQSQAADADFDGIPDDIDI